jgi:hypothetical protein
VSLLEQHRDALVDWLAVVTTAPEQVAVSVIPWARFAKLFPCPLTGDPPDNLEDPDLLGSFQNAVILYGWKHIVDRYLLSNVAKAVQFFNRYLELMTQAIPVISYAGTQLHPTLLPNAPYHFPIHGSWPLIPDWMSTFQIDHLVSPQARLWAPSTLDIQEQSLKAATLRTIADQGNYIDPTTRLSYEGHGRPPFITTAVFYGCSCYVYYSGSPSCHQSSDGSHGSRLSLTSCDYVSPVDRWDPAGLTDSKPGQYEVRTAEPTH